MLKKKVKKEKFEENKQVFIYVSNFAIYRNHLQKPSQFAKSLWKKRNFFLSLLTTL